MTAAGVADGVDRRPLWTLLFGNFAIGMGVIGPAAMMNTLVEAFAATPARIGSLISWGAVVLCVGAPVLAFLTNRMERRLLLTLCLALYAVGHFVSAFAADFGALLAARLAMISAAAVFTPQAASAVGLMFPPGRAAPHITFVFLGWTLAAAAGAPLLTLLAELAGWRGAFLALAGVCTLGAAAVWLSIPAGLNAPAMPLAAWRRVLTHPTVLSLLAVTASLLAGQFMLFPYLAAELKRAAGASPGEVAIGLALYGGAGFLGAVAATRIVGRLGPARAQMLAVGTIALGLVLWSILSGAPETAFFAVFIWGLGFAASNSLQQARLIAVAPELSSASVALNTSVLYLGQAVGTSLGGALIDGGAPEAIGWGGLGFALAALGLSWLVMRRGA